MQFETDTLFHVYNRGNNKQVIFFNRDNYIFFLKKVRKEICPFANILAYCLMPNHFHFLLHVKSKLKDSLDQNSSSVKDLPNNLPNQQHPLSRKIGTLLSSYTRAINIQEKQHGSLFQQKTKAELICHLEEVYDRSDYLTTCFYYIHQNPLKAKLVSKLENWEYSSFRDFAGFRNGSLVNRLMAEEVLDIDWDNFYEESYEIIEDF